MMTSVETQRMAEELVAKLMNRNVDAVWVITQALDDVVAQAERERPAPCPAGHEHSYLCVTCAVAQTERDQNDLIVKYEAAQAEVERLKGEVEHWKASYYPLKADLREAQGHMAASEATLARVRGAVDKARRETASDPRNRWCRNATIILNEAWAALEGR